MKTRFNIVDFVIVFIVIASIAVGCFLYFRTNDTPAETVNNNVKVRFVIEVKDLTETTANSFVKAKGCKTTFGETASGTGTIVDVEKSEYEMWVKNSEDGTIGIQKKPDRYSVRVTIESDVVKSDISYTSGSEAIRTGKEMPFNSYGVGAEGCYIVDLAEAEWGVFYDS